MTPFDICIKRAYDDGVMRMFGIPIRARERGTGSVYDYCGIDCNGVVLVREQKR